MISEMDNEVVKTKSETLREPPQGQRATTAGMHQEGELGHPRSAKKIVLTAHGFHNFNGELLTTTEF